MGKLLKLLLPFLALFALSTTVMAQAEQTLEPQAVELDKSELDFDKSFDETDLGFEESGSDLAESLQSNDCSLRVILQHSQIFWDQRNANNYCQGVYRRFGLQRGCFVQQFNDGSWSGAFQSRFHFSGRDYFSKFQEWSRQRVFRGQPVEIRLNYGNSCSHRGGGGGGYPLTD